MGNKGKTNHGVKLYGHCLCHIDVHQCGIGAFVFYLYLCFHVTGEMENPPDFTDNKAWFDIKLLVDVISTDRTKPMANDSYAKGMKHVLRELHIASRHYVHLGRVMGPVLLEFEEITREDIKNLGNWEPSTQEARYSTKLPMKALRTMASYESFANHGWVC